MIMLRPTYINSSILFKALFPLLLFNSSIFLAKNVNASPISENHNINKKVFSLIQSSEKYLEKGNLPLATFETEKIFQFTQNEKYLAIAWKFLGDIHFKKGEYQEAENNYKKSLDLEERLSTRNSLIRTYLKQEQISLIKEKSSNIEFKSGYIDKASEIRGLALNEVKKLGY